MSCAHIYSALDQTARKINLAKFTHGKCSALIVTDLAARGLDIPLLDNVINYSFPAKGKLFLHRVGKEPAGSLGVNLCILGYFFGGNAPKWGCERRDADSEQRLTSQSTVLVMHSCAGSPAYRCRWGQQLSKV